MKKILIFASFLLFLTLFLPFIGLGQLESFGIFGIFKKSQDFLSNPQAIIYFLCFIVGSFFISFGYSKKVKIPTMGLIGTFIYLKVFYGVLLFITSLGSFKGMASNDVTSYLFGNKGVVDVVLTFFVYYIEDLKIGFYILIIGFLLNSIGIYNIVKNTYIYIDCKINGKEVKDEEEINSKSENKKSNIEIKDEEKHLVQKIPKVKLVIIFLLSNVLNVIISILFLVNYFPYIFKFTMPASDFDLIKVGFLFLIFSTTYVNITIINKYVKYLLEKTSMYIFLLLLILSFLLVNFFVFSIR